MSTGRRDASAIAEAQRLTDTAERMRANRERVEVHEIDRDEVAAIRRDLADAMAEVAREVEAIKGVIMAIGSAADTELRRRN